MAVPKLMVTVAGPLGASAAVTVDRPGVVVVTLAVAVPFAVKSQMGLEAEP